MPGMIVWYGRVAGASAFGWPGTRLIPRRGSGARRRSRRDDADPNEPYTLWMNETAIPLPSTTQSSGAAARQSETEIEGCIGSDERSAGGEPLVGEQVGGQRSVVDERLCVVESELHCLDLEVWPGVEALVQRQSEERRNALAVRRQLAQSTPR